MFIPMCITVHKPYVFNTNIKTSNEQLGVESAFPSWPGPITSFAEACLRSIPDNGSLHININKKDLSASLNTRVEREMFYLTTHSTHFIYGYMASDIWLRTILIVRKETRCRHIGYSYRLTARVLLYAPSHRQDNTYHGLCYTSRGALAGTRKY